MSVYSVHVSMYSLHVSVYRVHVSVYSLHVSMYRVHVSVYSVQNMYRFHSSGPVCPHREVLVYCVHSVETH